MQGQLQSRARLVGRKRARLASPDRRCAIASTFAERAAASRPARSQYPTAFSTKPASLKWRATSSGRASIVWGKSRLERAGDPRMQFLATLPQQALISGVTHQRVLEDVGGRRRNTAAKDKLGRDQTIQRCLKIGLRQRNDGRKQLVIELAANAGADLGHLLHRGEPIEARHQRVVQRRWYRQRRERPVENVAIAGVPEQSGFEHGFGQFLGEERHALRPRQDLLEHFRGQRLAAGDPLDQAIGPAPAPGGSM